MLTPESVVLCLHCGALDAQFIYGSTYSRLLGSDWSGLTGPVLAFRQAIRERQARADDGHDEDLEDLWNG